MSNTAYEIHPIAKCYPKITGKEFTELKRSIRAQGLLNPITLYEGQILDGGNRYRACVEENVTPHFRDLPEGINAIEYAIAQNESRRHLTIEQRAFIGAKLARLRPGGDRRSEAFNAASADGITTESVAKKLRISSKSIERARKIQKEGAPELAEAAEKGDLALAQAERIAALPREQQTEVLDTVKGQKEALARAKDFRLSDEFKSQVVPQQNIIDAPSIYPIDLQVPSEHEQIIKDLRSYEKRITSIESEELKAPAKCADAIAKESSLNKRFVAWANSVKRKAAARRLILNAAQEFKKELKAEKKPSKTLAPVKKVRAVDRQWNVFVPQFKALLKLFKDKEDRLEIRRRIDDLLTETGWPYVVLTPTV
jgi:transposase